VSAFHRGANSVYYTLKLIVLLLSFVLLVDRCAKEDIGHLLVLSTITNLDNISV